jgi:HEXXH motif-containing protein
MSGRPVESTNVVPRHHVAKSVIEQVFAGAVDAATVAVLRDGQRSRRLLLLKELLGSAASTPSASDGSSVEHSWAILVAAEKRAPETVRQILSYPSVGTWLVRIIRKIRGIIDDDVPVWVDMGYLNSIAAAAAIRAGVDVEAAVPAWHGRITLPTIGQFEVAGKDRVVGLRVCRPVPFLEAAEGTWIPLDEVPSFPLRSHSSTSAGRTMCWTVDDIDPYRTFAVEDPARLAPDEFENWRRRLDDAWSILVEEHAEHVQEVTAAEPVIVPVAEGGGFVASSSSSAFGAICLATPESPQSLAETVVHELQHSKLNALLDLVPLQRPGEDRLCFAPWRRDPRPLSGLLHGIYAFVGVTEYWHRQLRSQAEAAGGAAVFHFAHHREQIREALRWLGPVPELSAAGARFLEVASARLAACDEVVVVESLREVISMLCAENRLAWQMRHLAPPMDYVEELANRWLAGGQPVLPRVASEMKEFNRPDLRSPLSRLLIARALDPEHQTADPGMDGEVALVNGACIEATEAFGARIRTDPDDDGAWVGLLMAMASESQPETVSATYRRIKAVSDTAPDPVILVEWFADC